MKQTESPPPERGSDTLDLPDRPQACTPPRAFTARPRVFPTLALWAVGVGFGGKLLAQAAGLHLGAFGNLLGGIGTLAVFALFFRYWIIPVSDLAEEIGRDSSIGMYRKFFGPASPKRKTPRKER